MTNAVQISLSAQRSILIVFCVSSFVLACSKNESLLDDSKPIPTYSSSPNGSTANGNGQTDPSTAGSGNGSSPDTGSQGSDSGTTYGGGEQAGTSEVYPVQGFTATGSLAHRGGGAQVRQKITAALTKTEFTINTLEFVAYDGKETGKVNEDITDDTGPLIFNRVDTAKLPSTLQSNPIKDIVVFSDRITDNRQKRNKVITLGSGDPFPVMVIPAGSARYDPLYVGPVTLSSAVTVDGKSFKLNWTITRQTALTANTAEIAVNFIIPEDKDGELYELFPMSKTTIYKVNTDQKRIESIDTNSKYNDEKDRKGYSVSLNFTLCSSNRGGQIENIPGARCK